MATNNTTKVVEQSNNTAVKVAVAENKIKKANVPAIKIFKDAIPPLPKIAPTSQVKPSVKIIPKKQPPVIAPVMNVPAIKIFKDAIPPLPKSAPTSQVKPSVKIIPKKQPPVIAPVMIEKSGFPWIPILGGSAFLAVLVGALLFIRNQRKNKIENNVVLLGDEDNSIVTDDESFDEFDDITDSIIDIDNKNELSNNSDFDGEEIFQSDVDFVDEELDAILSSAEEEGTDILQSVDETQYQTLDKEDNDNNALDLDLSAFELPTDDTPVKTVTDSILDENNDTGEDDTELSLDFDMDSLDNSQALSDRNDLSRNFDSDNFSLSDEPKIDNNKDNNESIQKFDAQMKLDLAVSFLSISDITRAKESLQQVLQKGDEEQIKTAKALLSKLA
ncbi:MAG: FimV/HubP family polar landmark protein [Ostreibacterium sp.]